MNELRVNNKSVTKPLDIRVHNHFTSIGPNLTLVLPNVDTDFESYIILAKSVFNLKHTTAGKVFKILKLPVH